MKRYMICIVVALIACVAQVNAVNYNGTYRGRSSQPAYMAPATATAPTVDFQSTSAMPVMMSTESILNEDGTVNAEAYGVGQRNSPAQRRIGNPIVNPNDPGNVPLGDGLWVLMLLAGAYILARTLRTKRAITK